MKTPLTQILIRIPDTVLKRIDGLADQDYCTRTDVVRRALLEYLRKRTLKK